MANKFDNKKVKLKENHLVNFQTGFLGIGGYPSISLMAGTEGEVQHSQAFQDEISYAVAFPFYAGETFLFQLNDMIKEDNLEEVISE